MQIYFIYISFNILFRCKCHKICSEIFKARKIKLVLTKNYLKINLFEACLKHFDIRSEKNASFGNLQCLCTIVSQLIVASHWIFWMKICERNIFFFGALNKRHKWKKQICYVPMTTRIHTRKYNWRKIFCRSFLEEKRF